MFYKNHRHFFLSQFEWKVIQFEFDYGFLIPEKAFQLAGAKSKKDDAKLNSINYVKRYPFLRACNSSMTSWQSFVETGPNKTIQLYPASSSTHNLRVLRAIMVHFPVNSSDEYLPEFRWLYRSWIEMMKHEPTAWRTDLVVMYPKNFWYLRKPNAMFQSLNCSFKNRRNYRSG